MANTQVQFGFRQIGYLPGSSYDMAQTPRAIQSTYSTVIGFGDIVMQTNATSPYIIQGVASSTPTQPIVGVFVGCLRTIAGQAPSYSPCWTGAAATDGTGYVIDAPNATFLAACSSAAITTSNIGHVVNYTTAGLTATTLGGGISIMTIDSGTIGTAAGGTAVTGLPFRVVGLYNGVGNGSDPATNFNWIVVGFNNQINRAASA